MEIIIIALVCSQLATPNHADCVLATSVRHQRLELAATNLPMCGLNGQIAAAAIMHVDYMSEYVKIDCVLPSGEINRMPG